MAEYQINTIESGITQITVSGSVESNDSELFRALSHLSNNNCALVNLLELSETSEDLFLHLADISSQTKIKVIVKKPEFVTKCNEIGLQIFPTIKSASLSYAGEETLRILIAQLRDVPILNTEAYKLIQYVASPDANFPELEKMLQNNAGLCSQILRTANSPYFMRSSKAETLQQAMVTLGFAPLRQIFVYNFYNSVGNFFGAQKETVEHGQNCAKLAEYIAKSAGASYTECAKIRLIGLLHDVGRQALAFFFPQQYEKVQHMVKVEQKPSFLAELVVFGIEHQSIGSILANRWNFPDYLSKVIADHHYLQAKDWNTLTLPVFCANNFLNQMDGDPFSPFYHKLEGYFFLKRAELPWKDIDAELLEFLDRSQES
ncbi:MAG: HDOD domain-containing protein [Candidatus Riflebacteria bacterium]|nr:HDOD domain-containing protein [Candidatus Riflebacteria bacterium]